MTGIVSEVHVWARGNMNMQWHNPILVPAHPCNQPLITLHLTDLPCQVQVTIVTNTRGSPGVHLAAGVLLLWYTYRKGVV